MRKQEEWWLKLEIMAGRSGVSFQNSQFPQLAWLSRQLIISRKCISKLNTFSYFTAINDSLFPSSMIRSQGGICIADEVQTGLGRTGEFWTFQVR